MEVTLRIRRFDPEKDKKPRTETYTVEADPNDQVLDLLNRVKWDQDGSLSYRRSCGHGVCGSDAMRINGVNRLACKVLVREIGAEITVEPLLGMPVVKDLVVEMTGFFEHYRDVMPYLVNDDPAPERERLQSPEARERYDDTTKCILCAACTTSCPTFWGNEGYIGPAAIVQAHRFLFDDRDQAGAERLQILSGRLGVWACHTAFNCTRACPREIQVTRAIGEVKRAVVSGRLE
ncbi:MAG TPA: succinate dehydrogenase iron-sulfur subunit [Anaerolineales bacterium]|nr:succinate dehydrogenase iron-sulfur subunit [Anaerolineales bacterium]